MVVTITLNPAIDYLVTVPGFQAGQINRAEQSYVFPGGKGVNVSIMLNRLGVTTRACGFLAGETGKAYEALLNRQGLCHQFVWLKQGFTRINTKVTAKQETEINGNGPEINQSDIDRLVRKLQELKAGDYLVLSGNVPRGLTGTYAYILERLQDRGIHFVADTTGRELMETLHWHPFLIKPNLEELEELCGMSVRKKEDLEVCVQKLRQEGARNILVSMGSEGAVLFTEDGLLFRAEGIRGTVCNTVGAGDSMLAGFLAGFLTGGGWQEALALGTAAGTATAFAFGIGEREEIERIRPTVKVRACAFGSGD